MSAAAAMAAVLRSDSTVFVHSASAAPRALVNAMAHHGRQEKLHGIRVLHIHVSVEDSGQNVELEISPSLVREPRQLKEKPFRLPWLERYLTFKNWREEGSWLLARQ